MTAPTSAETCLADARPPANIPLGHRASITAPAKASSMMA